MAPAPSEELFKLQDAWKDLFQKRLPAAAQSKDEAQNFWPVHVDHCFARIILDKVVGGGAEPWIGKLKTPAYKNMTREQLKSAIKLGEQILSGDADLDELDESSLRSRGKAVKTGKAEDKRKRPGSGKIGPIKKAKTERVVKEKKTPKVSTVPEAEMRESRESTVSRNSDRAEISQDSNNQELFVEQDDALHDRNIDSKETGTVADQASTKEKATPSQQKAKSGTIFKYFIVTHSEMSHSDSEHPGHTTLVARNLRQHKLLGVEEYDRLIGMINHCDKTTFQKRVLSLLLQIPRGKYTTYGHLAKYLQSSPRAVGNALRNNPLAPDVPCHRVLAAKGALGGFGGSWGKNGIPGENDAEKKSLLHAEGLLFDAKGTAVGNAWDDFQPDKLTPF